MGYFQLTNAKGRFRYVAERETPEATDAALLEAFKELKIEHTTSCLGESGVIAQAKARGVLTGYSGARVRYYPEPLNPIVEVKPESEKA